MKRITLSIIMIIFSISITTAQNKQDIKDPVGKWKFEAPYAPEGYTSGIIEVGFPEKQYSTSITFAGSEYKLTGEKVKYENEALSFVLYIEDQNIAINLKMEDGSKMTGKAVYSEGEIPLTLTRSPLTK